MFERFTDRARKVMALANQEAQRLGHEYIGTEHILAGILLEGSGVGANILRGLDVDLDKLRGEILRVLRRGSDVTQIGKLPQTPEAKKVIGYAIEEARGLGHNYVGTEHLLLGLLREQDGIAAQTLANLGVRLDTVRNEIRSLLGGDPNAPPDGSVERLIYDAVQALQTAQNQAAAEGDQDRACRLSEIWHQLSDLLPPGSGPGSS